MAITALPTAPSRSSDPATFSDDADTWVAALSTFTTEANALQTDVNAKQVLADASASDAADSASDSATSASNAATSANDSAASAASALLTAGTNATSTTSLTPSIGSKSFTLAQTGKTFVVGQFVSIADSSTPSTKYMLGAITAFNAGTGAITVDVTSYSGSSAGTAWVIAASAPVPKSFGVPIQVSGTSQAMVAWSSYIFTNTGAQSTGTLPASATATDRVRFDNATGRTDLLIARNSHKIMGLSEDLTIRRGVSYTLEYIDSTLGWRFSQ
jgi:hypothetical protein